MWVVAGDGGFQMTLQELATVVQERLPIKIAILNNGGYPAWCASGRKLFFQRNYEGIPILGPDLRGSPRPMASRGWW